MRFAVKKKLEAKNQSNADGVSRELLGAKAPEVAQLNAHTPP